MEVRNYGDIMVILRNIFIYAIIFSLFGQATAQTNKSLLNENYYKIILQKFYASPSKPLRKLNSSIQSVINNGDFSQLDADGNLIGWLCQCGFSKTPTCEIQHDSVSNHNSLVLRPGCRLYSDVTLPPNRDQSVSMDILLTNREEFRPQDFSLIAFGTATMIGDIETAHPMQVNQTTDGQLLHSNSVSLDVGKWIYVKIFNSSTTPMIINHIDAYQNEIKPLPKSATLLKVTHITELKIKPNSTVKEIWLPMPLDYASQVPVWIELNVEPKSAIDAVHYTQDKIGNWGAIVNLKNDVAPGTELRIFWQGIVLTRVLDESERAAVYAAPEDPNEWLNATPAVDAQYPGIKSTSLQLVKDTDSPLQKMANILDWSSRYIDNKGEIKSLDATSVFETKNGSCTGFANLASAVGRAAHVPTRTIANYLVGWTQQTHYINEFYLGPDLGWRRVEPQASFSFVTESYGVMMRIVTTLDEGKIAFHHWALPGVPYLSLMENLNDPEADVDAASSTDLFIDCPECDNRAEHWIDLRGSHAEMKKIFMKARAQWKQDFQSYLATGVIDSKRQAIRSRVGSVETTADLNDLLDQL